MSGLPRRPDLGTACRFHFVVNANCRWLMTAHIEVLHALLKPSKDFAAVLAIFQSHAQAVAAAQSADGRWHQVMTNSSSWLETSATGEMGTHQLLSCFGLVCAVFSLATMVVTQAGFATAMFTHTIAVGVIEGWLPRSVLQHFV
jgi:hypothetical protein